jgi:hypothetical protein
MRITRILKLSIERLLRKRKTQIVHKVKVPQAAPKSEEGNPEQALLKCSDGNLDQVKI